MKKEEIEEIEAANAAAVAASGDQGGESSQGQEPEAEIGGQCLECNLQFDNREQLSNHFKTVHRMKKDIKCSECGEVFKNVLSLKEHFATHTGETYEKPFKCQYCDKRYLYNYAVVQHEKDAHLMQPQQCNVCHIVLKSERALQKHMKLHEGQISEDLWKCSVCDKKYTDRPSYALHMAEHRGEKTYYCKYCQKGFPHKGNYSTHMQRHLGIKPFKCQFCSKSFVRKDDMKSHMRVHTGEKPFSCMVCGMKFAGVSNLREHERAKHNVSFSKRNPVTTPRQHRTKQHRGSKTVEPIDITQEGALADLADVVTGVLNTSKDNQAELVIEQPIQRGMATSAAAPEVMESKQHTMTVLQQPDGTFTQVQVSDQQEQGYEQLYTMGDQVYQVVMDTSSGTMKQILPEEKEYPEEGNVLTTVDHVQEGQINMDQS